MKKRYFITGTDNLFGQIWIGSVFAHEFRHISHGCGHFYVDGQVIASADDARFKVIDSGGRELETDEERQRFRDGTLNFETEGEPK